MRGGSGASFGPTAGAIPETKGQARAAIVFLYRDVLGMPVAMVDVAQAKRPSRLPNVLSRGEVDAALDQLAGVHRLVATLLYSSGLRLGEALPLRVKDLLDLSLDDMRRQFDVNYWGQVHGSRAAVPHLRKEGGAPINVASALADRAIPLQGNYCAAKHALKAFTDSLRMELEEEGAAISVTLVKPGSIDTPFFEKARGRSGKDRPRRRRRSTLLFR